MVTNAYVGKSIDIITRLFHDQQNDATLTNNSESNTFYRSGFTSVNCSVNINECESLPCQHSGECHDLVGHYSCQCQPGYTGISCENEINECSSSPCGNGGNCTDIFNGFRCTCPSNWTGEYCDTCMYDILSTVTFTHNFKSFLHDSAIEITHTYYHNFSCNYMQSKQYFIQKWNYLGE